MGAERAGTYLYCVARAPLLRQTAAPLAVPGIGGPGDVVRAVEYEDLAAVVGDAPAARYDVSRQNLLAHQRVVEEVMARSAVLPVSFGTVAGSDDEVRENLLRRGFDDIHRHLDYVGGRVALGLKVLWHRERLFAEIVAADPQVRALRDRLAGQPPTAAYHERIRLGELTAAAIAHKCREEAAAMVAALRHHAVETRVKENMTDLMVLNAAFLVEKSGEAAFDAAVQDLGATHAGRLIFQYVGPLPPYDFVDLRLRRGG